MNKFILDIGGTNIEYKVITDKDTVSDSFAVNGMNKDALLKTIGEKIDSYNLKEFYVGISSPTAVDTKTGYCNGMSGIKDYQNFNLYEELQAVTKTKLNIKAINDGKASLLGVIAANFKNKKPSSAVMVSLGTGIGGAVYIDGKIFGGFDNMAGELGYPIWAKNANISVNLSPVNVFKREFPGKNGKEIFEAYPDDKATTDKINAWLSELARFLTMISTFINPEVIVFHGGVTHNEKFQKALQYEFGIEKEKAYLEGLVTTKLKFFTDKRNYGILGAEELLNEYKL